MNKIIFTPAAPAAIGPYSQAVEAGGFIFVSGQLPIDPSTGAFAGTDIAAQTGTVLKNIEAVLKSRGLSLENVVKTTVFMADLAGLARMNEVYASFFSKNPPARAAIEAKALPKGALVEIDAIAVIKD